MGKQNVYITRAAGRLSDAYTAAPHLFAQCQLLLVCVDSMRDLTGIAKELLEFGIECNVRDAKIWIEEKAVPHLLGSGRYLNGFDAIYVFGSCLSRPNPGFDITTEADEMLVPPLLANLARDLRRSGARAYLADGCGLVAVSLDEGWSKQLTSALHGEVSVSSV